MSNSQLRVNLRCDCGRSVAARSLDAGSRLPCSCGKLVDVPLLSKLRQLAGKDTYITNPAEAIRKMLQDGASPAGRDCVVCGASSAVPYACCAACESRQLKGGSGREDNDIVRPLLAVLNWVLFGWVIAIVGHTLISRRRGPAETETVGHEVQVEFPLPVCGSCSATSGGVTNPKVARRLMELVPLYQELLRYYPDLKLSIQRPL